MFGMEKSTLLVTFRLLVFNIWFDLESNKNIENIIFGLFLRIL